MEICNLKNYVEVNVKLCSNLDACFSTLVLLVWRPAWVRSQGIKWWTHYSAHCGGGGGVVKHPGFEELLFCLVSLEISGSPAEWKLSILLINQSIWKWSIPLLDVPPLCSHITMSEVTGWIANGFYLRQLYSWGAWFPWSIPDEIHRLTWIRSLAC